MKKSALIGLLLGWATATGLASSAGDQVVVVYNSRLAASKALAEYYAEKRQVPTNQVFGFDLTTEEEISRTEFRDSLQQPLAKAIAEHKLWRMALQTMPATNGQPARAEWHPAESKVRYAVLCYGVPLRIAAEASVHEKEAEKMRPEMRRNEAAVDSELALLPIIEDHPPLSGPLRNPGYTVTNSPSLDPTNGLLMVARLDGPSPEIARGLVDQALEAERNGLWGRAYFDLRNTTEPGYKMGDDWIRNAADIAKRLGFETVVDEQPGTFPAGFPMSHIAFYMGWYNENASGPFSQPTVEFMPGAFAYHLHSASASSIRTTNRFWVGPLLAKGATATMGCVFEPYLAGTPDLGVFAARFLFSGFTFGEAAYACQPVLSWQTTVVGDPLYRPFGRNLEKLYDQLQSEHSPLVEWYYLRLLDLNLVIGKPVAQCVEFLEQLGETKHSPVLAEKLADLYVAQGKPASAVFEYARALKLNPSAEQRLRLLLTLGGKLEQLGRDEEAYDTYQRLVQDFPRYPDKTAIYQKLAPLARKLGKTQEFEKWEAALRESSR